MDLSVLLQVIPSSKLFPTHRTGERSQPRVDSFVPGQLLVSRKRLATGLVLAFERSLTCE